MELEELQTDRRIMRRFTHDVYKILFEQCSTAAQIQVFAFETETALQNEKEKYETGSSHWCEILRRCHSGVASRAGNQVFLSILLTFLNDNP